MLLLPFPVTALCGILLAIQFAMSLGLNESGQETVLNWFAFVPDRLLSPDRFEGGVWPLLWTPFTHAFLHAGWEHVGLNAIWLAIFATPVTQRYGGGRMLVLFLGGAAVGAAAFAATTLPQPEVLVGASGGVAALTGAAVRFIFQPPVVTIDEATGERRVVGRHLASLAEFIRSPAARFFSVTWLVLNGLVPLVPMFTGSTDLQVAWQAHIGGFLFGLLAVPLLERRRR
ncbi:MAG TPA: rhomboid family intramembrane serine protease [Devosia sp.]|nr:rhomboid family intramembrane serine protease [Devosia sp.]